MNRDEVAATVARVRQCWAELMRRQDAFIAAAAVRCPAGCGHCCTTPVTEASVLEMLPLALHLYEQGQAPAYLDRLAAAGRPCAMYAPHPTDPLAGRCPVYDHRPTMCRLYGFSARTRIGGSAGASGREYVACPRHIETQPQAVAEAQAAVDAGLDVPMIATEHARVMMVNRTLGRQTLPINEALRQALAMVVAAHEHEHDTDEAGPADAAPDRAT